MDFDDALDLGGIFPEPERPPSPEARVERWLRGATDIDLLRSLNGANSEIWESIDIRVVGSHPLWGHYLWNSAKLFGHILDFALGAIGEGMNVLELGAGGALPSIVAALNGARRVVITDYPDPELIENIKINVEKNIPQEMRGRVDVQGFKWGANPAGLLDALKRPDTAEAPRFDIIIMSDLIFNHSQHDALIQTCEDTLAIQSIQLDKRSSPNKPYATPPLVMVLFTHHRPHLAERDMNFFEKATQRGWKCRFFLGGTMGPMFPEDPGDLETRSTVYGWVMERESSSSLVD